MRLWSVSVDLDGLGCYAAIHGLKLKLDDRALRAVPEVALERFCELFEDLRISATFFAVGSEVQYGGDGLRRAASGGHEIGSHSFAHDYAMSRWDAARVAKDVEAAEEALAAAGVPKPRGFRAPGYSLSAAMLGVLRERGYAYDSSLLPSPPYMAAKACVLAWYALRGRRSASILASAGLSRRGAHRRRGVRELPMATLPVVRVPAIGTSVLAAPWLARAAFAGGHFNFELHGIDALDATDVPAEIAAVQPGVRTKAADKLERLRAVLQALPGEDVTLEQAAFRLIPA
ncbi:MAG TPA: polysaccharide deacetylase family protein [Myxococcales bacterium]|nr:polysaccharide deacetylase family protein [Myxococcales bacterium]